MSDPPPRYHPHGTEKILSDTSSIKKVSRHLFPGGKRCLTRFFSNGRSAHGFVDLVLGLVDHLAGAVGCIAVAIAVYVVGLRDLNLVQLLARPEPDAADVRLGHQAAIRQPTGTHAFDELLFGCHALFTGRSLRGNAPVPLAGDEAI